MKILIATPVAKTVEERYCHSLFGLCKYETARGNDVDIQLQRGPWIHKNRNDFVRGFLRGDWEYLLQLDMDIVFPCDLIERLLTHGKDIVFGMYGVLKPDGVKSSLYSLSLRGNGEYTSTGWFGDGLIEIDAGGTGVCLARRKVFEAFPDGNFPWFDFDPAGDGFLSEDITFSRRAKAHGFTLYGDCNTEIGHIKDTFILNKLVGGHDGDTKEEDGRRNTSRKARRDKRGVGC